MSTLTNLSAWRALQKHYDGIKTLHIRDLLQTNPSRSNTMMCSLDGISIDFSRQLINDATIENLLNLANQRHLNEKIKALFHGGLVNASEQKPALHTSLRAFNSQATGYSANISQDVCQTIEQMGVISNTIRNKQWLGASGKPITHVINIGIGGSDLGPKMSAFALNEYATNEIQIGFISDIDPLSFNYAVANLNPETTLFIVSSKSFTTHETIINFKRASQWIGHPQAMQHHFIAVTANQDQASQYGFKHCLPIWDWVGGRYSLCSAINLLLMITIGYQAFTELLNGANTMDEHFYHAPLANNMPVILALLGIWNINFLNATSHSILCYSKKLQYLVPYLQQLDMESNGKRVDNQDNIVDYATGPIVWGGLGNQAQHAYYQLLCQGTHRIPCDFILLKENHEANQFAEQKIQALSLGNTLTSKPLNQIPGNMPLSKIVIDQLTPYHLGALIALYEHKIFCQSVIWDINPFDQPGVESSKKLTWNQQKTPDVPIGSSLDKSLS